MDKKLPNSDVFNLSEFKLEENSSLIDGKHIIGVITGPHFVPEGFSRNKRFYPKKLWEKTLNEDNVKTSIQNRTMFGTIGHNTPLTDETVGEGKASHFMESIWIDESLPPGEQGQARACILNTPAGRVLKTLYGAGCKLFSSSRAKGSLTEVKGVPTVDENTFVFKNFDYVIDGGFLQALPSLVESHMDLLEDLNEIGIQLENTKDKNKKLEDNSMDGNAELLERLSKENAGLDRDLKSSLEEVKNQTSRSAVLTDRISHLEESLSDAKKNLKVLESYTSVGSVEEINKMKTELTESKKKISMYEKCGTVEDINKINVQLTEAKKKIEQFEERGTVDHVDKLMEEFKSIRSAKIKSDKLVETYKKFGTPEDLQKKIDEEAKFVKEFGTRDQVIKLVEQVEGEQAADAENRLNVLAKELELPVETVKKMTEKGVTEAEMRALRGKGSEGDNSDEDPESDAYKFRKPAGEQPGAEDEVEQPSESFSRGRRRFGDKKGSSTDRLYERYSGASVSEKRTKKTIF